jgi:glutamyl-tRNA reductase
MHLVLVGLSHHTAPLALRERLGVTKTMLPARLDALAGAGCDDAVVLSTCNRTEVYVATSDPATMALRIVEHLCAAHDVPRETLEPCLYTRVDADAARHLFRVACGLDSLVVGEPEILGQVKEAYRVANETRGTGALVNRLFHGAFGIGKRVRTETGLAEGAVSLSYAALTLARKIFGALDKLHVVVFGAGEMARLSAVHFAGHVASTTITARTADRADVLARETGAVSVAWNARIDVLARADILVSATGAEETVVGTADLARRRDARHSRPLFVVDLAVPRDVDPEVALLDDVFLYNVDDLRGIVEDNLSRRQLAITTAEQLVQEEVAAWMGWLRSRAAVPTVVALRQRFERIRQAELARLAPRMTGLGPEAQARVNEVTRLVVEKLLLTPTEQLKAIDDRETMAACSAALRRLFDLDDSAPGGSEDAAEAVMSPADAAGTGPRKASS